MSGAIGHDLVALGEVMLRLAPPSPQRLEQATSLDVQIGGAEANVAAACARLGLRTALISAVPAEHAFRTSAEYDRAVTMADTFTRQCQRTVHSEAEERQATNDGWRTSPQAALEHFEQCERDIFTAAAEASHAAQKMTSKAQAERAKREAATSEHVTS